MLPSSIFFDVTDWAATLLEGSVGGIVGALGAFGSAVWVVKRQARADRALAREERIQQNAATAVAVLMELIDKLENRYTDEATPVELGETLLKSISDSQTRIIPFLPLLPADIKHNLMKAIQDKEYSILELRSGLAGKDPADVTSRIKSMLDEWYEQLRKSTVDIIEQVLGKD
jgi:hypothetical protein